MLPSILTKIKNLQEIKKTKRINSIYDSCVIRLRLNNIK